MFLYFCLVTYSVNEYLMSTYYMLDIVLENEAKICACPHKRVKDSTRIEWYML